MVPPASHRVSRVPWYSGSHLKSSRFNYVAITLYSGAFQLSSFTIPLRWWCVRNPSEENFTGLACSAFARRYLRNRISFFSSGYLDVSVPRVPLIKLCIHLMILRHYSKWVSSFGNLRIKVYVQLPEAYRSLSRPSSALSAKASALRP